MRYSYSILFVFGFFAYGFGMESSVTEPAVLGVEQALARLHIEGERPLQGVSQGYENTLREGQHPQGVAFWDWDDTILPSTELNKYKGNSRETLFALLPEALQTNLKEIDKLAVHIICWLRAQGVVVCIVTGAEHEWVTLTARLVFPGIHKLITTDGVPVFSVYHANQKKSDVFRRELTRYLPGRATESWFHVFSFGDTEQDRNHFFAGCSGFAQTYLKSVKLIAMPTALQLQSQLALIVGNFDVLLRHKGSLDFMTTSIQPIT